MRLATQPGLADNAYLNLLAASQPFWGDLAPLLVTFLVLSGSLLSCATAASNSPRMLYQLALDWENRSEHRLNLNCSSGINPDRNSSSDRRIIEISISSRFHEEFREYVGILRDITERKRQKEILEAMVKERTADLATANEAIATLNERLKADNLRMGAELDILRQMQQLILPKQQELEEIEELDIAGYMEPADEVGGDYYDILHTDGIVTIGLTAPLKFPIKNPEAL